MCCSERATGPACLCACVWWLNPGVRLPALGHEAVWSQLIAANRMAQCCLQIEGPLENAGNRCSQGSDLSSLILAFKCVLISPFLLLSSTPGHAQCQRDRLSFTTGLSFTDVSWIKYEGCWESGHLEKERKTRKLVWVGAPWGYKVRLEKASLTGMEARAEDLNGQSLCPWLVHTLTSSTLSLSAPSEDFKWLTRSYPPAGVYMQTLESGQPRVPFYFPCSLARGPQTPTFSPIWLG